MKQLTKEQLTEFVIETMREVYKENAETIVKHIASSGSDNVEDLNMFIGNCLGACMAETMLFCSQVLIETLDHVLNNE